MTSHLLLPLLVVVFTAVASARDYVALLGTFTDTDSRGIYVVRLNGETGELTAPALAAEMPNPEFLALHPSKPIVYALTQERGADGKNTGAVAALAVESATGRLTLLNRKSSGRGSLTHLAIDPAGRTVVAASYGGGYAASFQVQSEGEIGPPVSLLSLTGPNGPNAARQNGPHPHSATIAPDGRFAFVADLGLDRVFAFRISEADSSIAPNVPAYASVEPGAGPRHTAFSPDGKFFYVLNELNGTVTSCRYDPAAGVIQPFERVSTLPEDFTGKNGTSEIRIHPSGQFVYAANRGHNSIAVFRRDSITGSLESIEHIPCGGESPRNFALTPDGAWLLCANQNSNNLTVFRIHLETGRLTATPHTAQVPKAVCVLFLP